MEDKGGTEHQLPRWKKIAEAKWAQRDAAVPTDWRLQDGQVPESRLNVLSVPSECGILSSREIEITDTEATLLVQKLISREYSSYEARFGRQEYLPVTKLYISRSNTICHR